MKSNLQLAIIDEDPNAGQPNHLKTFKELENLYQVKKLVREADQKTILVLQPRLEEWVLARCAESGVSPATFHLQVEPHAFKDRINSSLDKFELLVLELQKKKNKGILYLQQLCTAAHG